MVRLVGLGAVRRMQNPLSWHIFAVEAARPSFNTVLILLALHSRCVLRC